VSREEERELRRYFERRRTQSSGESFASREAAQHRSVDSVVARPHLQAPGTLALAGTGDRCIAPRGREYPGSAEHRRDERLRPAREGVIVGRAASIEAGEDRLEDLELDGAVLCESLLDLRDESREIGRPGLARGVLEQRDRSRVGWRVVAEMVDHEAADRFPVERQADVEEELVGARAAGDPDAYSIAPGVSS
jgi:hypothetical protein